MPPPATIQLAGLPGSTVVARTTAATVIAVMVAAPSSVLLSASRASSVTQWRNSLRSSDFGGRRAKNGCVEHALDRRLVDLAGRRDAALVVLHLAGAQPQEVVDQRIAGAGVEGDEIALAVDERHVGDAADIEHADRMRLA